MSGLLARGDLAPAEMVAAAFRQTGAFVRLPGPVKKFYLRALWSAARASDSFTLRTIVGPTELGPLIRMAGGGRTVAEVGTGSGCTALALALAEPARHVHTCDPLDRAGRERYRRLVPPSVSARVHFRTVFGQDGPAEGVRDVDLLFIDSSRECEEIVAIFRAWEPALRPGGVVAFHDYHDPRWPAIDAAIEELGLEGEGRRAFYVWRKAISNSV